MKNEAEGMIKGPDKQQEKASSSPHQQQAGEWVVASSLQQPSSFINDILNPSSIFSSNNSPPALNDYLKIKAKDKPKDTLKEIQQKKQAFISYISELKIETKKQSSKNLSSRVREQYPEFTFYKSGLEVPSRLSKCNITVCNIRGEVIKYYPNVFLSKKEGKIAKFISEHKESFTMVYDYTSIDSTVKVFPSLLNEARMLYYVIFNVNVEAEVLRLISEKIEENNKGLLENIDNKVYLISNQVLAFRPKEQMEEIFAKLRSIQEEQQQFLIQFRGSKQSWERNLAFDMMIINMWRQFSLQGVDLSNKIIQLFVLKEGEISETIVKDHQILHTPKRLQSSQNCSLCLAKNEEIKRPRRTYWICTSCSAQKEKPIYLCKGCFKDYHTNNDVYIYRKNEKKTKKYKRIIRQKINRNKRDQLVIKEEQNVVKNVVTASDRTLMELDRKCDDFFNKLQDLMEGKCYSSAEFYIQMLMNMSIIKTQEYLNKIGKKEINLIKQEQK